MGPRITVFILGFMASGLVSGPALAQTSARCGDPSATEAFRAGFEHQQAGRTSEALPHYERCLQIDPDCGACHYEIGWSLWVLEKWNEVVSHWERVLELDRNHADARKWLVEARAKKAAASGDRGGKRAEPLPQIGARGLVVASAAKSFLDRVCPAGSKQSEPAPRRRTCAFKDEHGWEGSVTVHGVAARMFSSTAGYQVVLVVDDSRRSRAEGQIYVILMTQNSQDESWRLIQDALIEEGGSATVLGVVPDKSPMHEAVVLCNGDCWQGCCRGSCSLLGGGDAGSGDALRWNGLLNYDNQSVTGLRSVDPLGASFELEVREGDVVHGVKFQRTPSGFELTAPLPYQLENPDGC